MHAPQGLAFCIEGLDTQSCAFGKLIGLRRRYPGILCRRVLRPGGMNMQVTEKRPPQRRLVAAVFALFVGEGRGDRSDSENLSPPLLDRDGEQEGAVDSPGEGNEPPGGLPETLSELSQLGAPVSGAADDEAGVGVRQGGGVENREERRREVANISCKIRGAKA